MADDPSDRNGEPSETDPVWDPAWFLAMLLLAALLVLVILLIIVIASEFPSDRQYGSVSAAETRTSIR